MPQTITVCLMDMAQDEEGPLITQTVQVKPASDQVMIHLVDEHAQPFAYVCVEVLGGKVVLDYSTAEDFAAGPHSTERIPLADLTEGKDAR